MCVNNSNAIALRQRGPFKSRCCNFEYFSSHLHHLDIAKTQYYTVSAIDMPHYFVAMGDKGC